MTHLFKTGLILSVLSGTALLHAPANAGMLDSGDLVSEVHQQHARYAGVQTSGGFPGAPLDAREEERNEWRGIEERPVHYGRAATEGPAPRNDLGAPISARDKEANERAGLRRTDETLYMQSNEGAYEPGAPLSARDQERNERGLPY